MISLVKQRQTCARSARGVKIFPLGAILILFGNPTSPKAKFNLVLDFIEYWLCMTGSSQMRSLTCRVMCASPQDRVSAPRCSGVVDVHHTRSDRRTCAQVGATSGTCRCGLEPPQQRSIGAEAGDGWGWQSCGTVGMS